MDSTIDTSKLSDRELLLLMHERQGVMGGYVKDIKDGTQKEMHDLSLEVRDIRETKADKADLDMLQRGQNRLFNYLWFAFGVLGVLQVIIPLAIKTILH